MLLYKFLDLFFLVFHTLLILFNLFGWVFQKTRIANLMTLSITAFSWFILGIWYGFGYCVCVDWHWSVKIKLGELDLPNSYIKYLVDQITGFDMNASLADTLTAACFFVAIFASLLVNIKDWRQKRKALLK